VLSGLLPFQDGVEHVVDSSLHFISQIWIRREGEGRVYKHWSQGGRVLCKVVKACLIAIPTIVDII